jgi:hypothetical protein
MPIEGYTDYQRREYCKDVRCPTQLTLDTLPQGSEEYEQVRGSCWSNCLHTTHEFHSWLIEKGYLVIRPVQQGTD